ncbi:hypothetical protein FA13DRAFT_1726533, partial [Coprinellus micaceus]
MKWACLEAKWKHDKDRRQKAPGVVTHSQPTATQTPPQVILSSPENWLMVTGGTMVTDDVGNADRNPPITDSARVSTFPFPLILRSIGTRSTP